MQRMTAARAWLRRHALGLSEARGKRPLETIQGMTAERRATLERVVDAFVSGYGAALEHDDPIALAARLRGTPPGWMGFAFEGAGMALWLRDSLSLLSRGRWRRFQSEGAPEQSYLLHVGAGWALARLRQNWQLRTARMDPLLRWLVLDGYGFHQGYFHPGRFHHRREVTRLPVREHAVFDQGLGRSLWFVHGANVERIPDAIRAFPAERREDLWSGVGLACAYAGGVGLDEVAYLLAASGRAVCHFAQGVAFAVAARTRGADWAEHTEWICRRVWGRSSADVADLVEGARTLAEERPAGEGYELWRAGLRAEFATTRVEACDEVQ